MADSDSTNATTDAVTDVAGELETLQNTLKILNDLTSEQACNWSSHNNKEMTFQMVERIIVLTNLTSQRLDEFSQLVSQAYQIGFGTPMKTTA